MSYIYTIAVIICIYPVLIVTNYWDFEVDPKPKELWANSENRAYIHNVKGDWLAYQTDKGKEIHYRTVRVFKILYDKE